MYIVLSVELKYQVPHLSFLFLIKAESGTWFLK